MIATLPSSGPAETSARSQRFAGRAMGSPLRLSVAGADPGRAAAAWRAASATFEEAEAALSRFRDASDLVALNRRAGCTDPAPVDRLLVRALAAAAAAHRRTGGSFDPRVLADLERLGYRGVASPASEEAAATTRAPAGGAADGIRIPRSTFADGRWLHLDARAGRAAVAAPVDLGGIGKGLALRWAWRRVAAAVGVGNGGAAALLEAGGDLVAGGPAPQGGPWAVGVEDPDGDGERAVIAVAAGAVATSSIRVHAWRAADGRSVHHLLDPRTGEPGGEGLTAVTVASPDPAWAEVWSKTLFLEGARGIAGRARALGLAAWWIRADGRLEMTAAARAATLWVADEA